MGRDRGIRTAEALSVDGGVDDSTEGRGSGVSRCPPSSPLMATAAIPTATCRSTDRPETGISGETTAAERDAGLRRCRGLQVQHRPGRAVPGRRRQLAAHRLEELRLLRPAASGAANPSGAAETHPGTVVVDVSDPTHPTPTDLADRLGDDRPLGVAEGQSRPAAARRRAAAATRSPGRRILGLRHLRRLQEPGAAVRRPLAGQLRSQRSVGAGRQDLLRHSAPQHPEHRRGQRDDPGRAVRDAGRRHLHLPQQHRPRRWRPGAQYPAAPETARPRVQQGRQHRLHHDVRGQARRPRRPPATALPFSTSATSSSAGPTRRLPGRRPPHLGRRQHRRAERASVTIAGKPYIVLADEAGGGIFGPAPPGKSANGFPRLIDITDPAHPATAAEIRLGVAETGQLRGHGDRADHLDRPAGRRRHVNVARFFAHSCHYCQVDDVDDAQDPGLQLLRRRPSVLGHPRHRRTSRRWRTSSRRPRETKVPPGLAVRQHQHPAVLRPLYDWATSKPSFPKDRGADAGDVWTTSQDNGFMVINLYSKVTVIAGQRLGRDRTSPPPSPPPSMARRRPPA